MLQKNQPMTEEKVGLTVELPEPQIKRKTIRRAFTTAYTLSNLDKAWTIIDAQPSPRTHPGCDAQR